MIMSFCLNICKRSTRILKTLCVDFVIDSTLEFHSYSNKLKMIMTLFNGIINLP